MGLAKEENAAGSNGSPQFVSQTRSVDKTAAKGTKAYFQGVLDHGLSDNKAWMKLLAQMTES